MNRPNYLSEEILEQHHEQAFKWAMSCCDYDQDKAREVMQLVYIAILEKKAVYRFESGLRTWLFAVIRHTAIQQYRKQSAYGRLKDKLSGYSLSKINNLEMENVEFSQRERRVYEKINKLSRQQRQVVELVYYRDFSLSETAGILGLILGTVTKQLSRAKQKLSNIYSNDV